MAALNILSPTLPVTGSAATEAVVRRHHNHPIAPGRCGAVHVQDIAAPLPAVWSLVRRFDHPQSYKGFVRACYIFSGDGGVGSVREVEIISGLPACNSFERLDVLDDEKNLFGFTIIGGDHRLANYQSTTTLHQGGGGRTTVVESYVVDVPEGSTENETCCFADTIVKCNLQSLSIAAERVAHRGSQFRN